jgi:hypothetical protein
MRAGAFGVGARLLGLAAAGLLCLACAADAVDELNVLDDCNDVCSAYSDCITDIDVTDCVDRCEDMVDSVDGGMDVIDSCADCIDDRSCAEAAACVSQCPPIAIAAN